MLEHITKMYFDRIDAGNFRGAKRLVDEMYNTAYEIYNKSKNCKEKMTKVLKKLNGLSDILDNFINHASEQNRRIN